MLTVSQSSWFFILLVSPLSSDLVPWPLLKPFSLRHCRVRIRGMAVYFASNLIFYHIFHETAVKKWPGKCHKCGHCHLWRRSHHLRGCFPLWWSIFPHEWRLAPIPCIVYQEWQSPRWTSLCQLEVGTMLHLSWPTQPTCSFQLFEMLEWATLHLFWALF